MRKSPMDEVYDRWDELEQAKEAERLAARKLLAQPLSTARWEDARTEYWEARGRVDNLTPKTATNAAPG